jgi:lipopolysaccharide transport system permease protein
MGTSEALLSKSELPPIPALVIEPSKGWVSLRLNELWQYRELLYFLTWRDIKVRYKQTIVGASWAILQPLLTMVVFSIFFGGLAHVPSDGIPYPIFSYTALVPWTLFAYGLQQSSNSLVGSSTLITKIYFPRLIIPISSVLSGILDFVLAFAMLIVLIFFYSLAPSGNYHTIMGNSLHGILPATGYHALITANVIWLPLFMVLTLVTSLGIGLWLSALNVQFRDIRYIVPFLTQFWMFATPIAYSSSLIKNDLLRTLYGLNPMTGVVEGFRWALLGTNTAPGPIILVSTAAAVLLLISGAFYFRRMEKTFADVV